MKKSLSVVVLGLVCCLLSLSKASELAKRPVILLTGYWVPTNEMLRPFSNQPEHNPDGWIGSNWEGLGYDVMAYFPEFPEGSGSVGTGDFRVDYDAVKADFPKYTSMLHPVAIISFGHGDGPWEIETKAPDYWNGNGKTYPNTLPFDAIAAGVNATGKIQAWVDRSGDAGDYLCGFISRLGAKYKAAHSAPSDPYPVYAQGFIHTNDGLPLDTYREAVKATLRATIASFKTKKAPLLLKQWPHRASSVH